MADSEKLVGMKKAYAEIILNTAKEAAARVMVADRRAFRYQRELAEAKEEALRMMVRLKHMMDSRIYEAEVVASRKRNQVEELEAQLQEAEDIVKDLREELSVIRDELDDLKRKRSQRMSEQQAYDIVSQGQEEQRERVAPSISVDNQIFNSQTGHVTTIELGNLCDLRINGSLRDGQCETLRIVPTKEPELINTESSQKIYTLTGEDLRNNDGDHGTSHLVKGDLTVQENFVDSRKCITPTSSLKLCVSVRKPNSRLKQVKTSNEKIHMTMKRRARKLGFLKINTPSAWKRCQSLAKQVLNSLKQTNLVTSKTSPTSESVQSEVIYSALRESEAQNDVGHSSSTTELCSNTGLFGSILACSIQSTPENGKSSMDKASTGEENGSADSSVTCFDAEIARAPSCATVEEYEELANGESCPPKNERSIKYTFQRKRKKESIGNVDENDIVGIVKRSSDGESVVKPADIKFTFQRKRKKESMRNVDENDIVGIVKRSSDKESVVKPTDIESNTAGIFTRLSQQSGGKEDNLKEFKGFSKRMNVDKQEFKISIKRMDVEKPTDTELKTIGIVPKASRDSRRFAQVARQLLSMSE